MIESFSLLCIYNGIVRLFFILFYLYCIHILELPLGVWRVRIDLGLHLGKLFLLHLFICIIFLFFLVFLRFILLYIDYICEHFGS